MSVGRCVWMLLFLTASGCGRSQLDGMSSPSTYRGPVSGPGAAGTGNTVDGTPGGGDGSSAGGTMGAPQAGSPGGSAAPGGSNGSPPAGDDPTTFGDDRPGFFVCHGAYTQTDCRAPELCCYGTGCIVDASQCDRRNLVSCDGKEDCPGLQQCCWTDVGLQCQDKCATTPIRHVSCGGAPCVKDTDGDSIPDAVDFCLLDQSEDGRGPLPEDGCSDFDADGIIDGIDKCPNEMENGLPPNPTDGCP